MNYQETNILKRISTLTGDVACNFISLSEHDECHQIQKHQKINDAGIISKYPQSSEHLNFI